MAPAKSATSAVLAAVQRATLLFRDVPPYDPEASANAQRPYRQLVRAIADLQAVAEDKNCPGIEGLQSGRSVTSTPAPTAPRSSVSRASAPAPTPTPSQQPKPRKRSAETARLSDEETEDEEEDDAPPPPQFHQIGPPSRRSARMGAKAPDAPASATAQAQSSKKARTKAPVSASELQRIPHEARAIEITKKIVRGVYVDPMQPKELYKHVWTFYNRAKAGTAQEREVEGARLAHAGVAYADAHVWANAFRSGRVDAGTLKSNFAALLFADDAEDTYGALMMINQVRMKADSMGPAILYAYSVLGKIAEIKVAQVWLTLNKVARARHYTQRFYNTHKEDWFEGMTVDDARLIIGRDYAEEYGEMRSRINTEYGVSAAFKDLFVQLGPAVLLFPEFDAKDVRGTKGNRSELTLAYSLLKTSQPRDITEDELRAEPDAHALSMLQLNAQHALLSIIGAIAGDDVEDYLSRFLQSMEEDLTQAIPPYPYKEGLVEDVE